MYDDKVGKKREPMRLSEVIVILTEYNRWRRAEDLYGASGIPCPFKPSKIGEAIDDAVMYLEKLCLNRRR